MKTILIALVTIVVSLSSKASSTIQMSDTRLLTLVSVSNKIWKYSNGNVVSEPRYSKYSKEDTIYAIKLVTDSDINRETLSEEVLFGDLHREGNLNYDYRNNDYLVKISEGQYDIIRNLIRKDNKKGRRGSKVWTLLIDSSSGELLKLIDQEDNTQYSLVP